MVKYCRALVETMFRRFLWNGDIQAKDKALIPWDKMCLAKTTGGLNITDLYVWNKAALLKHLWNLSKKKDKL